jgi:hypothetical protein
MNFFSTDTLSRHVFVPIHLLPIYVVHTFVLRIRKCANHTVYTGPVPWCVHIKIIVFLVLDYLFFFFIVISFLFILCRFQLRESFPGVNVQCCLLGYLLSISAVYFQIFARHFSGVFACCQSAVS